MEMTDPGRPALSVIVPAANEEEHIGRCLDAILAQQGVGAGTVEVIVAANGCTDGTADGARSRQGAFAARGWPLTVLDIPEGGKVGAMNLADGVARGTARAYLDADVVIDADLLKATLHALETPQAVYATGRLRVAPARSWFTRRFGAMWVRLPFMAPGSAPGAGFFAVNAAGRARWAAFPAVIADDSFVRWTFAPGERIEVQAGYSWPLVEGFGPLVRVRRRQDAGGAELARLYPELERNEGKTRMRPATHLSMLMAHPVDYAVYAAVKLAVRLGGKTAAGWARGRR